MKSIVSNPILKDNPIVNKLLNDKERVEAALLNLEQILVVTPQTVLNSEQSGIISEFPTFLLIYSPNI